MAAGDQQTYPPAAVQAHDPGQLRRHVPRGEPQRLRTLRANHAPRLLGAQLRLPPQLLLQWIHKPVSFLGHVCQIFAFLMFFFPLLVFKRFVCFFSFVRTAIPFTQEPQRDKPANVQPYYLYGSKVTRRIFLESCSCNASKRKLVSLLLLLNTVSVSLLSL